MDSSFFVSRLQLGESLQASGDATMDKLAFLRIILLHQNHLLHNW